MNRRSLVSMSPEEVSEYLSHPRSMTLATHNEDGTIHLTAMFYVIIDGDLWFWSYGTSKKIRNLYQNPSLSILVESGEDYSELQGVSIVGDAEIHEDPEVVLDMGWKMSQFHGLPSVTATPELVAKAGKKRVAVRVKGIRTTSWDHGKLEKGVH
jgi:general stress protein 26